MKNAQQSGLVFCCVQDIVGVGIGLIFGSHSLWTPNRSIDRMHANHVPELWGN
jgi:hypothetical protein